MKKWYTSKTLIFNTLAAVAVVIQAATGTAWLDAELQAAIIVVLNVALRLVTNAGLTN